MSLLIKEQGKLQTRGLEDSRIEAYRSGTGVGGYVPCRRYGATVSGQVGKFKATKGTAEEGPLMIGSDALLNRARYVPLARTALDWADTADIPSTTARPAGI